MSVIVITAPLWSPDSPSIWPPRYDWSTPRPSCPPPVMTVMTSTSYGGGSHNRGGHGWAATIRYPVKQPYRLFKIKKMFAFHYYIVKFEISYCSLSHYILSDQTPYPCIGYLRTDISGIDQASFFHLTFRRHSPSYHSRQLLLFLLVSVINLFNFFRLFKSSPFHTVIRIHLISLSYHILFILPSHFSSMEQMLMLML